MENKQYLLDTNILIELAEGLTVVTDNVRHFERIPGLKMVDSD